MSRKDRITHMVTQSISLAYLNVEDESSHHHVPKNAETHFKLIVVSSYFETLNRVDRHKYLHGLLKKEFDSGLHALSLHLFTPEEWKTKSMQLLDSPACKDGYKNR